MDQRKGKFCCYHFKPSRTELTIPVKFNLIKILYYTCITYLTSNDLIFSPETNKNYVLIIVTLTGLNKLQFNLTSLYFGNRRKQPIRLINNLRGLFVAWQASTGNRNERLCCFDKHIKKIRKHQETGLPVGEGRTLSLLSILDIRSFYLKGLT